MKLNIKSLSLFVLAAASLASCSSDDDAALVAGAPEITDLEYGKGSSHGEGQVAYKGADLHLEAAIYAEAGVSSIAVSIHAHDLELAEGEEEWDFEKTFTDEKYRVLNPTFHEHIDVPENIPSGAYHLTLTVTDANGNSTEVEGHLDILSPVQVSDLSIAESVARGDDFHAEFMIEAVNGVHQVNVNIHAHGLPVNEGDVEWAFDQDFEAGYHEETAVEFHEHIDVPATAPVGSYHMVITIEDEEGHTEVIDTHLDVTA